MSALLDLTRFFFESFKAAVDGGTALVKVDTELTIDGSSMATETTLAAVAARLLSTGLVTAADLLASVLAILGATTGAAVVTDANGTVQQYLRGMVTLAAARIGPQLRSASTSVLPNQPTLAAPAHLTLVANTANTTADLAAGTYLIKPDVDICWKVNASQAAADATWNGAGCKKLEANGEWFVTLTANQRISMISPFAGDFEYSVAT